MQSYRFANRQRRIALRRELRAYHAAAWSEVERVPSDLDAAPLREQVRTIVQVAGDAGHLVPSVAVMMLKTLDDPRADAQHVGQVLALALMWRPETAPLAAWLTEHCGEPPADLVTRAWRRLRYGWARRAAAVRMTALTLLRGLYVVTGAVARVAIRRVLSSARSRKAVTAGAVLDRLRYCVETIAPPRNSLSPTLTGAG